MTLKFSEELCAMTMKNNAKFEEELTFPFKTVMRNLTNFDSNTLKSKKNCSLIVQESCQVRKFSSMFSTYISRA